MRLLRRQDGFGLIDMMVGVVIALVALLVIFGVFAVSEQHKRNTTAIGEAQVNGLLSSFTMGLQLANSGNAVAASIADLAACDDQAAEPDPVKRYAKSWRPLPIMIIDGGAADKPDRFTVTYSTTSTIVSPALVVGASPGKYVVQSPTGIHPRLGGQRKDLLIAIRNAPFGATGECKGARADAVVDSGDPSCTWGVGGCVEVSYTGGLTAGATPYSVFNMGPADDVQKVLYDLDDPLKPSVLRSTQLIDDLGQLANGGPNPIASNVVNMKLQYGIDTDGDGLLDTWVSATGPWGPAALMSASPQTIKQIKAVRIGIIVRSDQFDKEFQQDVAWSMFDGTYAGTFAQSAMPPGNWRYRVYETVLPLRNEIWNK